VLCLVVVKDVAMALSSDQPLMGEVVSGLLFEVFADLESWTRVSMGVAGWLLSFPHPSIAIGGRYKRDYRSVRVS
jgi:hypothetical protein